jgi:protein-S-isoprenylcysteine O-methyltransferase Ste14
VTQTVRGWTLVAVQAALLLLLVVLPHRPITPLAVTGGLVLVAAGAAVLLVAFRVLGRALTPTPVPVAGAGLRTDGPYRWVRHPVYTGVLLAASGFTVALGSWWTAGAWVLLLVFFWGKWRWEDRLLRSRYGAEWSAWAARTGAIVPGLGRVRDHSP